MAREEPPALILQDGREIFKFRHISPLFDTPGLWQAFKQKPEARSYEQRENISTWLSHQGAESLLHRLTPPTFRALAECSLEFIVMPAYSLGTHKLIIVLSFFLSFFPFHLLG
jgi:hypothetical protein